MDQSLAPASHSPGSNAGNEFVFVIHQDSNDGQYYPFLFKRMFNRPELSDVTLRCENRDIPAHRIVLAAHSPFFIKQFEEKPTDGLIIAIDNVKYDILMATIELMYNGTVSIEPQSEPALNELLKNFEMNETVYNSNRFQANVNIENVVDKNVKPIDESKNVEEKKSRVESHDGREEITEYDKFVSSIDEIMCSLTNDNIDAKVATLLRHNIYTKERLVTVVNLIMRQVITIANKIPTICYAKLSAAIKSSDRTGNGFSSILLNVCKTFFTRDIERKLERPDYSDAPTRNTFDQQIDTLRMIEYHYSHERLRRIVRFLSELYMQNVINGGILLDIQAKELENLDRGIHDYFFVLLAIFDTAGKMLSEEHSTYTNECVAKLKERLIAMENNKILSDVKTLITHAIEISESGWKNECSEDIRHEQHSANDSLPKSDVEEHLYWIKNSVARQPAKLTYHLARNYAEQNKEPRRRGKKNANKPPATQKNMSEPNKAIKSNESESNTTEKTVTARKAVQREDSSPPVMERTTNDHRPVHQNDATNNEPRNDDNTKETGKKRIRPRTRKRDQQRQAKFIADKIASKRK